MSQCWFCTPECFPDAHYRQIWEQEEEKRAFSCNISRQKWKCRASCKLVQFTTEWQSHQGPPGRPPLCLGRRIHTIPKPQAKPTAPQLLQAAMALFLPWGETGECTSEASRNSVRGLTAGRKVDKSAWPPLTGQGLNWCYSFRFKGICEFINRLKFQSLLFPTHTEKRLQSRKKQSALSFTSRCTK